MSCCGWNELISAGRASSAFFPERGRHTNQEACDFKGEWFRGEHCLYSDNKRTAYAWSGGKSNFYYQLSRWICTKRSNNAITRLDHWTLWCAHERGRIVAGQLCKLEQATTDQVNRAMLCGFRKALAAHTHTEAQFTSTPGGGVTANTTCQDKSVTTSLLSSQWTRL